MCVCACDDVKGGWWCWVAIARSTAASPLIFSLCQRIIAIFLFEREDGDFISARRRRPHCKSSTKNQCVRGRMFRNQDDFQGCRKQPRFWKKKYRLFVVGGFFAVVALLKMFYFSLIISYIYVDDSLAKQSIYIHIESCYFLNGKSYIYHLYVWCVCVYSEI